MLRRLLVLAIAIITLIVAGIATLAAPATASADVAQPYCPAIYPRPAYCSTPIPVGYATAPVSYKGWVYLNLNYCPPQALCAALYRSSTSAWSWTGSSWSQSSINGGWVYVYPYTGEWRWAWTQASGWVAISGHRFEIRNSYRNY
jgi:hypothetical protein